MLYLVDAFSSKPFRGNPAGVCFLDEYPEDTKELQDIARYYNWSEIAFIKHMADNLFRIRWFSPLDEAPLCGHATLASAHVIFSKELVQGNSLTFQYNTGFITVTRNGDILSMSFPLKPVKKCSEFPFSVHEVIGIEGYREVLKDDLIYIVVLNSKEDVINAIPNFEQIKKVNCRAIAITARDESDFDFCSRYFAPKVGIYEDPVCGSMHCRLAYYWAKVLGKSRFRAFQASKRSGILDVELTGENTRVNLSSKACTVCELNLLKDFKNWN